MVLTRLSTSPRCSIHCGDGGAPIGSLHLRVRCSGRGPLRCRVASALPFRVAGHAAEWRVRWAAPFTIPNKLIREEGPGAVHLQRFEYLRCHSLS
jgi:hypothetical protein